MMTRGGVEEGRTRVGAAQTRERKKGPSQCILGNGAGLWSLSRHWGVVRTGGSSHPLAPHAAAQPAAVPTRTLENSNSPFIGHCYFLSTKSLGTWHLVLWSLPLGVPNPVRRSQDSDWYGHRGRSGGCGCRSGILTQLWASDSFWSWCVPG